MKLSGIPEEMFVVSDMWVQSIQRKNSLITYQNRITVNSICDSCFYWISRLLLLMAFVAFFYKTFHLAFRKYGNGMFVINWCIKCRFLEITIVSFNVTYFRYFQCPLISNLTWLEFVNFCPQNWLKSLICICWCFQEVLYF